MATLTEPAFTARLLTALSVVVDPLGDNMEFRDAIQTFRFTPNTPTSTTKGGSAKSVWTASGNPTWMLNVKLLQDLEQSGSLLNYLIANAGLTKSLQFIANGGAKKVTASVILVAPDIGGDIDAWLDSTIQMGVQGKPVIS